MIRADSHKLVHSELHLILAHDQIPGGCVPKVATWAMSHTRLRATSRAVAHRVSLRSLQIPNRRWSDDCNLTCILP
jgi:hypothetical protein